MGGINMHKYDKLERKQYPLSDIVIIHFDKTKILKGTFLPIIRVKSRMGSSIPILAIINGTAQEIFSVLKAGVYDYITTIENVQEYKKKIRRCCSLGLSIKKNMGSKEGRAPVLVLNTVSTKKNKWFLFCFYDKMRKRRIGG